jgi:hypothetical protein
VNGAVSRSCERMAVPRFKCHAMHKEIYGIFYLKKKRAYSRDVHSVRMKTGNKAV